MSKAEAVLMTWFAARDDRRAARLMLRHPVDLDDAASLQGLMTLVAQGDQVAFADVYDRLAPVVFGLARRVVRDTAQAEEIAQEVFVEMWRHASCLDRGCDARAWAVTMGFRRAFDRVRGEPGHLHRRGRRDVILDAVDGSPDDAAIRWRMAAAPAPPSQR